MISYIIIIAGMVYYNTYYHKSLYFLDKKYKSLKTKIEAILNLIKLW